MNDAKADRPDSQNAIGSGSSTEHDADVPATDAGLASDPGQPLIGFSDMDGFNTGDSLAQALLHLGEGHGINTIDADATQLPGVDLDMSDVGAAGAALDDLGSMLDQLGPSLDALVSEVNLFDIAIPSDFSGDA